MTYKFRSISYFLISFCMWELWCIFFINPSNHTSKTHLFIDKYADAMGFVIIYGLGILTYIILQVLDIKNHTENWRVRLVVILIGLVILHAAQIGALVMTGCAMKIDCM